MNYLSKEAEVRRAMSIEFVDQIVLSISKRVDICLLFVAFVCMVVFQSRIASVLSTAVHIDLSKYISKILVVHSTPQLADPTRRRKKNNLREVHI